MQPAVISIDLGASFTKVGYRTECSPAVGSFYDREAQLLAIDGATLIPSLAIQTGHRKQPWLFGPDAADVRIGKGMVPYPNWKAGLFHRENDEAAAKAAIVAQAFFTWLRPFVEGAVGSLDDKVVRIMLPAFTDFAKLSRTTCQCVRMAGWRPMELETTTEPHANVIGVFTRGRNVFTRGSKREAPEFREMFGINNPYIEKARAAVLGSGTKRSMTVGVIDIGAFTTDIALLNFDLVTADVASDGLQSVSQKSFEVGTYAELDQPLWRMLADNYGADFSEMSFREREEIKRQLYASDTVAVLIDGKPAKLGGLTDSTAIGGIVGRMADKIWGSVKPAIERAAPDAIYLTGGGASVALLAEALTVRCRRLKGVVAGPVATGNTTSGLVNWKREPLERVATALGGASILAPSGMVEPVAIAARELAGTAARKGSGDARGFRSCTCHGNPDCPKCGGSGYLER